MLIGDMEDSTQKHEVHDVKMESNAIESHHNENTLRVLVNNTVIGGERKMIPSPNFMCHNVSSASRRTVYNFDWQCACLCL